MSVTNICHKNRNLLWALSAGRCQYRGCNKPLYLDILTKKNYNQSYIAHIVADSQNGPRGDKELSMLLKDDISNLMLLCDSHHRLIDRVDVDGHPIDLLRQMKLEHEKRVDLQAAIQPEKATEIIILRANIGPHHSFANYQKASNAILAQSRYPASREQDTIILGFDNSKLQDNQNSFWLSEPVNLNEQIEKYLKSRLAKRDIAHLSVFAIGPQPLLFELGRQISDIPAADVYQLHRFPDQNWVWREDPSNFEYKITEPDNIRGDPVIILAISDIIDSSRIDRIMKGEYSIWTITVDNPGTSWLKSKKQLNQFSLKWGKLLNNVKNKHGESATVHVFPAVPVSIAVEAGRTWQSKAHLKMIIYDQPNPKAGFIPRITFRN